MTVNFSGACGIWNPNQNQKIIKSPIDIAVCDGPKQGGFAGNIGKDKVLPPWVLTENPQVPMDKNTPGICYFT